MCSFMPEKCLRLISYNFPDVISDPTLPRSDDHPCPKCKHREAVFFQVRRKMPFREILTQTFVTFKMVSARL